ncbi:MAG: ArsR/SmtB family transcription factor [Pirellulaceae bacterium]
MQCATGETQKVDAQTQTRYDARAKIVKALAHPTRLFIVDELSRRGERCVCDLTEMIGADISTVSKHLSLLKSAGIVEDEKRGNQVFYSLAIPCVSQFFDCIESVLRGNAGQCRRVLT